VVVAWKGPDHRYGALPDTGLLLWQAGRDLAPADGLYAPYLKWRVIYDWHYDGTNHVEFVGAPGHQTAHRNPLGESFSFSLGDVTLDGHPEVLASFDSHGSGGCRIWRVLSSSSDAAQTIFKRTTCETDISITNGQLQINAAIHRAGCNIHGCGDERRTLLHWTGDGWIVTNRSTV
jgi:hypothetical protein